MKNILLVILCVLSLTGCRTQRIQTSPQAVCANVVDTQALQRKQMYNMRLVAHLTQLKDYIEILNRETTIDESQKYYTQKAKALFTKDNKIIVTNRFTRTALSVDSFFHFLAERKIVHIKLDSIEVPIWDESIPIAYKDSIVYMKSKIFMFPMKMARQTSENVLPVIKENTEEGLEWSPLFGDLYISGEMLSDTNENRSIPNFSFNLPHMNHLPVTNGLDPILYKSRIKLMDEFFDRFNGKEQRIDAIGNDKDSRLTNLLLLFDGQMFQSFEDSVFQEAIRMAYTIQADSIYLNDTDTTWIAKAQCHCTLKGKPVDLTIYLNMEQRKGDLYKWVITKVEGECLRLSPSVKSEKIMLMPNAHENNFFALNRLTMEVDDYVTNYARKSFRVDETTAFYTYVYSGLLDIKQVVDLEFIFLQVPGYVFKVKHHERETFNAGWLISSFRRMNDEEKQKFLQFIYND